MKFFSLFRIGINQIARSRQANTNIILAVIKSAYYRIRGKKIWAHQHVKIKGLKNIETPDWLKIGTSPTPFLLASDKTYLNIKGKLIFKSKYDIGRGCRFIIGENAVCEFSKGYVTANSLFLISYGLIIGDDTGISWNCQFIDDDLHTLSYEGKQEKENKIVIGNHVWIGCNVTILKGVHIADNCVIAANSVVTKSFMEKGSLIAGNPAKVIKSNVSWK